MSKSDNKKPFEPFGINLSTTGRFGGAGLAAGASAASSVLILKMLLNTLEKRKEMMEDPDKHTLTLVLPAKDAEDKDIKDKSEAGVENKEDKNDEKSVNTDTENKDTQESDENKNIKTIKITPEVKERSAVSGKQLRKLDGKFDIKSANWQTLAASIIALTGGTGLGYSLIDKLYDMRRKKELENELKLMKQEYLDKLMSTKEAMAKSAGIFSTSKRRGEPSFGILDYPAGLAFLALLLGGGSVGYVTKKLMDEYNVEPEPKFETKNVPTIERIVFRTEKPEDDDVKKSSASDTTAADCVLAALGIYTDLLSGKATVLGEEKCAEAIDKAGTSCEELYKLASEDYDRLMYYLKANDDLRTTIKRLAMEKHPIMKYFRWAVNLPFVNRLSDDKLYQVVADKYGPMSNVYASTMANNNLEYPTAKIGEVKNAAGLSSIAQAYMGGSLASVVSDALKANNTNTKTTEQPVHEETEEEKNRRIEALVDKIDLAAKDKRSAKFLVENKDKIKEILKILAAQGKL